MLQLQSKYNINDKDKNIMNANINKSMIKKMMLVIKKSIMKIIITIEL